MLITEGAVAVALDDIGEGLSGDYDPSDPDDVALFRFSVYRAVYTDSGSTLEPIDDASYCTRIPADVDIVTQARLAAVILSLVIEPVCDGRSIKKLCESLSWIDADGVFGLEDDA